MCILGRDRQVYDSRLSPRRWPYSCVLAELVTEITFRAKRLSIERMLPYHQIIFIYILVLERLGIRMSFSCWMQIVVGATPSCGTNQLVPSTHEAAQSSG